MRRRRKAIGHGLERPRPRVDCAELLKAVADGTRLAVLQELMKSPRHVGELGEIFGVDQSLLSHHLAVLRDAGLVTSEREGKAVRYRLAAEVAGGSSLDLGCCRLTFGTAGRAARLGPGRRRRSAASAQSVSRRARRRGA